MLILNIVTFCLWAVVGSIVLIPQNREITKFKYALVWIVLMLQLLSNLVCGA